MNKTNGKRNGRIIERGTDEWMKTVAEVLTTSKRSPPPVRPSGLRSVVAPETPPAEFPKIAALDDDARAALQNGHDARKSERLTRQLSDRKSEKQRHKAAAKDEEVFDEALAAAREGRVPRVEDCDHLGTIIVTDVGQDGKIARFAKVVNYRDDPVGQMHKRGHLGHGVEADARLAGARRWQAFYSTAEIGGARGIDPTKEAVDGGRFEMPDTDARLAAQQTLNRLRQSLGIIGDRLVTWVLGHKHNLTTVATMLGQQRRMDQIALGYRFRECLDTIAAELGVVHDARGARGPRRRRDEFDAMARTANNAALHRAIGLAKDDSPDVATTTANKNKPILGLPTDRDPSP